jgi:hypothetical protein
MKTISNLRDLEEFGVIPLTGEADHFYFRCLCDLTRRGAKIVTEAFSLKEDAFLESWNHSEHDPHVGSIMLPYDAWKSIGVIALFDAGCHTVVMVESGLLTGFESKDGFKRADYKLVDDELVQTSPPMLSYDGGDWMPWPSCYGKIERVFQFGDHPHVGTRNVHVMSGRSV